MGLNSVERVMARRQIDALILSDPVDIVITRKVKVSAPGGGWRWGDDTELEPQQVTILPFLRRMTIAHVNTELGNVVDVPYILVARHNADIAKDDVFLFNGARFEVQHVDLKREVRVAAHVDYFGKAGTNG